MKLACPSCGSKFDLEQAVRETQHQELADFAARFGKPCWFLVYEYCDCFRQAEYGSITLKTRLRLVKEIWRLFDSLDFSFQEKNYRTSWPEIIKAMTEICNLQKRGFTNHNYLKKMLRQGAQRLSAEGLTAKEEKERERQRTEDGGRTTDDRGRRTEEFAGLASEKAGKHISDILKNLNQKGK